MHFVWKSDFNNEPVYTRAEILNIKELTGLKLSAGEALAGKVPEVLLEIVSEYPAADYFNVGPLFVVSQRLRALFDEVGAHIEYHSVTLLRNGDKLIGQEYYFANILEKIDCFDFQKSVYTMDGEFIDKIQKLEIDEGKAGDKIIFRLARSYDSIILASKTLKDRVVGSGISGVKFLVPSDWKW